MSMLDWNTYRQQLTVRIGEIAKLSPDTIKGYQALSAAGQKANLLGPKTRELISLAVAVTVRCDGCIAVHSEAAARHGARGKRSPKHSASRRPSVPMPPPSTPPACWTPSRRWRRASLPDLPESGSCGLTRQADR
jgi:AhpD family alkylhydroperoxidase